jgi:hypothetical protein
MEYGMNGIWNEMEYGMNGMNGIWNEWNEWNMKWNE